MSSPTPIGFNRADISQCKAQALKKIAELQEHVRMLEGLECLFSLQQEPFVSRLVALQQITGITRPSRAAKAWNGFLFRWGQTYLEPAGGEILAKAFATAKGFYQSEIDYWQPEYQKLRESKKNI
jgi:hypothetical protein